MSNCLVLIVLPNESCGILSLRLFDISPVGVVERGECQLDVWLWNFYWIQICAFFLLSSIIIEQLELFGPTILQYTAKVELGVLYVF